VLGSRAVSQPLIGVSTSITVGEYPERAYVNSAYLRAVEQAGGIPVLLPPQLSAAARETLWRHLDALVLTGGGDIEPARFGELAHPSTTLVSPDRDALELDLVDRALRDDVPLFGICRGLQVLNVALGGTLHRDRSEYPEGAREHPGGDWSTWDQVCAATLGRAAMPKHPSHPITVAPGTPLHAAVGARADVNSYHHQAVADLAPRLEAVAWADDGIIEAVALRRDERVLGVQWELQVSWMEDRRFLDLFRGLVNAAADVSGGGRGGSRRAAWSAAQAEAPHRPDRAAALRPSARRAGRCPRGRTRRASGG
jgi:putative glutamine amidotransferase